MSFRIHPEPVVSLQPLIKSHPVVAPKEEQKSVVVPAIIEPEPVPVVAVVPADVQVDNKPVLHPAIGENQAQEDVVFRIKRRAPVVAAAKK